MGIVGCLVLNGNVKVLCSLKILPFTIDVTDFSSSNNKVIFVTVLVKCLNIAINDRLSKMTRKYPKIFY